MKLYGGLLSPNVMRVALMLEELGLPYTQVSLDVRAGANKKPEYLAVSPFGKVPALVDDTGPFPVATFESGAILMYLAEKTGRFLPPSGPARHATLMWLFAQTSTLGPEANECAYHLIYGTQKIPQAVERHRAEVERCFAGYDARLAQARYLAGNEYTIADIASFPFMFAPEAIGLSYANRPHVRRWLEEVSTRPAVRKVLAALPQMPQGR